VKLLTQHEDCEDKSQVGGILPQLGGDDNNQGMNSRMLGKIFMQFTAL